MRSTPCPLPDGGRVLVVGCGYVGKRLAEMLIEDGHQVWGLKRSPDGLPEGVTPIAADVTRPETLDLPEDPDAVVYAVSPSGRSEEAYRAAYVDGPEAVLDRLGWSGREGEGSGRMILVSSTGVYGYEDGRVVDERTAPRPADGTGRVLVEGEHALHARCPDAIVLRLSGIYGPGREWTIRKVRQGDAGCPPKGVYTNWIHRDDAAGALLHLLKLETPDRIYLGTDHESPELREINRWLADRLGVPDPCAEEADEGAEPPGRRGTNKRCSGNRLVESGYRFRFSTFRDGYASLLDEGP